SARERVTRDSQIVPGRAGPHMRRDFRFLDSLHTKRAFLHHPAHSHRHIRILLHLADVGRAFFGEWRDVFAINSELAGDFLFADRSLVVIEEIETADLERAIVFAITLAY